MIEQIKSEWRTAHKRHTCDYCNGKIEPGERYNYYLGRCDGELYEWKSHERCQKIADEIWDFVDPWDGMSADDFHEGCSEVCRSFVCPDCGKWDTDECDESFCLDKLYDLFQKYELYRERKRDYYQYWKLRERDAHGQT